MFVMCCPHLLSERKIRGESMQIAVVWRHCAYLCDRTSAHVRVSPGESGESVWCNSISSLIHSYSICLCAYGFVPRSWYSKKWHGIFCVGVAVYWSRQSWLSPVALIHMLRNDASAATGFLHNFSFSLWWNLWQVIWYLLLLQHLVLDI